MFMALASTAAAAVLLPCLIRRMPHHCLAAPRRWRSALSAATGAAAEDTSSPMLGRYLDSVAEAAQLLLAGELVAFPTETVYGLGADARNATALGRIFEVKGRPRTDPLIVHVASAAEAEPLLSMPSPDALDLFRALAADFWPGPLTIVAPMAADLPTLLSAGTGAVGVRCPSHARARHLIAAAGIPVAAPSANRFGHVSPTKPEHVMNDLGRSRVFVLRDAPGASCEIGIESTVLKIDEPNRKLVLLRRGGVPEQRLARWIAEHAHGYSLSIGVPSSNPAAETAKAEAAKAGADGAAVRGASKAGTAFADSPVAGGAVAGRSGVGGGIAAAASQPKPSWLQGAPAAGKGEAGKGAAGSSAAGGGAAGEGAAGSGAADAAGGTAGGMAAPGMLLTHYAPDLPSFLFRPSADAAERTLAPTADVVGGVAPQLDLSSAAIIDFGGRAFHLVSRASAYRDLSPEGDALAAATGLFESLRWAEERAADGARCVLLPDVMAATAEASQTTGAEAPKGFIPIVHPEAAPALADRLFRAASGRGAALSPDGYVVTTDSA